MPKPLDYKRLAAGRVKTATPISRVKEHNAHPITTRVDLKPFMPTLIPIRKIDSSTPWHLDDTPVPMRPTVLPRTGKNHIPIPVASIQTRMADPDREFAEEKTHDIPREGIKAVLDHVKETAVYARKRIEPIPVLDLAHSEAGSPSKFIYFPINDNVAQMQDAGKVSMEMSAMNKRYAAFRTPENLKDLKRMEALFARMG